MKSNLILSFIIALFVVSSGCIANSQFNNNQEKYNLKYNFEEAEKYNYEVLTTVEKSNSNIFEAISIYVVSVEDNFINLEVSTDEQNNTDIKEESYYINMTSQGEISKITSNNFIVPEIQLELVSILEYPEKEFGKGDVWNSDFNKSGSYFVDSNLVKYNAFGNTTYECLDRDKVSVNGGTFDCIAIGTNTDYNFDVIFEFENKSLCLRTTGTTEGENWISLDKGILIKSEYNIDKNTIGNYSDIYNDIGVKSAYREIPFESFITSELVSIEGDL